MSSNPDTATKEINIRGYFLRSQRKYWTSTVKVWLLRSIRKFAKSDYKLRHACLPIRTEQLGSHWTDFREISYLTIYRKSVKKVQVVLKSDENTRDFTWISFYSYDHISFICPYNENYVKQTSEVCHPRCVFKLYGEVNSVKNTTMNIWLNDSVY